MIIAAALTEFSWRYFLEHIKGERTETSSGYWICCITFCLLDKYLHRWQNIVRYRHWSDIAFHYNIQCGSKVCVCVHTYHMCLWPLLTTGDFTGIFQSNLLIVISVCNYCRLICNMTIPENLVWQNDSSLQ